MSGNPPCLDFEFFLPYNLQKNKLLVKCNAVSSKFAFDILPKKDNLATSKYKGVLRRSDILHDEMILFKAMVLINTIWKK